jgi:hypothetical protein
MDSAGTIPQRSHSKSGFRASDEKLGPDRIVVMEDRGAALRRQEFLTGVVNQLRKELPEKLAGFQVKSISQLVKIYYDNERVHYEVWISSNRQLTEIGLHFEDGPVSTAAYLAYFDRLIVELKHELGETIELERWTANWGHLFEIVPLGKLTDFQCERVANRLAQMITILQPLVDAAAIPAERASPGSEHRGPWRHFRRR